MEPLPSDDVPFYEPKERQVSLTIRMPESLKAELADISDLWTKIEGRVGEGRVSQNEVILRILQLGVDGIWGEMGGKPASRTERDAAVDRLARAHSKTGIPGK